MGRYDDRDEYLDNQRKPVSNLFLIFVVAFGVGFIAGAVWGFFYFEALQMNEAYAQLAPHITELKETMSFGDSISVVVHSGTG